jgi:hypothetical protein
MKMSGMPRRTELLPAWVAERIGRSLEKGVTY